ncbi:MAG: hypothetical protein FJ024_06605 [Chloroflexi bacterium]|nr:hypothetical protein [Chloroflexota bacterium]
MTTEVMLALLPVIAVVMFPVVFIAFINIGGIIAAIKDAKAKREGREIRRRRQPHIGYWEGLKQRRY